MELTNGQYQIQGIDLLELCKKQGTPIYVYDAERIEKQLSKITRPFKEVDLKIKYAAKALTNQAILRLMKRLGCGLDVVSIQELELGLKAGFEPGEILYTPNSVEFAEIAKAIETGVQINIDNISILEQFATQNSVSVSCSYGTC
jgi:diaminopimelate decarboxylase